MKNNSKESLAKLLCVMTGLGNGELAKYLDIADRFQVSLPEAVEDYFIENGFDTLSDAVGAMNITNIIEYALWDKLESKLHELGVNTDPDKGDVFDLAAYVDGEGIMFRIVHPETKEPLKDFDGLVEALYEVGDLVTRVDFRWVTWQNTDDEGLVAVFPDQYHNIYNNEHLTYMRIGQHGGDDYEYIKSISREATESEYADLKAELENHCGYKNIIVVRENND